MFLFDISVRMLVSTLHDRERSQNARSSLWTNFRNWTAFVPITKWDWKQMKKAWSERIEVSVQKSHPLIATHDSPPTQSKEQHHHRLMTICKLPNAFLRL
jgi:hypothetical protein